ncbi:hypothetical protein IKF92_02745 [Candidatus Saccharibacteria bacterium]|nr:hypothetical protein [Candidatus Saccharibacteria bacterium]
MHNKNRNVILNIIMPFFTQVVSIIVALLVPRMLIYTYGSPINGLITSTNQIVSYFAIIESGICSIACAFLAKPLLDNNHDRINNIMTTISSFYKKFAYILLLFTIIFSFVYPIKMGNDYLKSTLIIILLCLPSILGYFYYLKYNLILFANGKQFTIIFSASITNLLVALVQYLLIKMNADIILIVLIVPLFNIIRLELLKKLIKKEFNYLSFKAIEDKSILDQKWDAIILVISRTLKTLIPLLFLNIFYGFKEISVFSIYVTIFHVGNSILTTIGNGLVPEFSKKIVSNGNISSFYKYLNIFSYSTTLLLSSCFVFLFHSFLNIYIGTDTDIPYYSKLLTLTFIINEAIMNVRLVPEIHIKATNSFKKTNKSMYIELALSFILTPLSCLLFGYEGILIGSIIGSIYRTYSITNFTKNSIKTSSFSYSKNTIFSILYIVICIIISSTTLENSTISGIGKWILLSIAVVIINALLILITQVLLLNKIQLLNISKIKNKKYTKKK